MAPKIPTEQAEQVRDQTIALVEFDKDIETISPIEQISAETIRILHERLTRIVDVIDVDVADKCQTVRSIFGHDARSNCGMTHEYINKMGRVSLRGDYASVEKAKNDTREKLKNILRVLYAMEFWMENGVIATQAIPIKDCINNIIPNLEKHFVNNDRSYNGLTIDCPDNINTLIHTPTLELLLINMTKNSSYNGHSNKLHIIIHEENNSVIIEISDDGTGITDNITTEEIFEWRKSGSRHGTGIGLGDARERMAAMGGSIECEAHGGLPNRAGTNGAKFILKLRKA